jgi:hypothetical protein
VLDQWPIPLASYDPHVVRGERRDAVEEDAGTFLLNMPLRVTRAIGLRGCGRCTHAKDDSSDKHQSRTCRTC